MKQLGIIRGNESKTSEPYSESVVIFILQVIV